MLLGSSHTRQHYESDEAFIVLLITQNRYSEAYSLLQMEQPDLVSTQYNIALCHYRACNYQQALINLDKAQQVLPQHNSPNNFNNDQFYNAIRKVQNEVDDYLQGITSKYVSRFDTLTRDAIIRLKTDCWLQLGNYAKVVETATPIEHKNYKNIANALAAAKKHFNNNEQ